MGDTLHSMATDDELPEQPRPRRRSGVQAKAALSRGNLLAEKKAKRHLERGDREQRAGRHEDALVVYRRVLVLSSWLTPVTLAVTFWRMGKSFEALGHKFGASYGYRRALELCPSHMPARKALDRCCG